MSLVYVRRNSGDMNDTEYYAEHVVFAVREFDAAGSHARASS